MLRPTPNRRRSPARTGLTLIELLVVILIIGILMALLIPAVGGAIRQAKQGQVSAEISNMATALADFKTRFNDYPPSRLYCAENGDYSPATGDSEDLKNLKARSAQYLRKFFPRVDIRTNGTTSGLVYDFNSNGSVTADPAFVINGPECLVFFLGGMTQATTTNGKTTYAMVGFSKSPTNPFVSVATSANRTSPFYEFFNGRLDDSDGNGVPCYLDPLGSQADNTPIAEGNDKRPYAYFSAYGSGNYDPEDYNAPSEVDSAGVPIGRQFAVSFLSTLSPSALGTASINGAGPNPYTVSAPIVFSGTTVTTATYQNAQSYQLMSAGIDRQWGIGGQYSSSSPDRAPFDSAKNNYDSGNYVQVGDTGNPRIREYDNLTNFSNGRIN